MKQEERVSTSRQSGQVCSDTRHVFPQGRGPLQMQSACSILTGAEVCRFLVDPIDLKIDTDEKEDIVAVVTIKASNYFVLSLFQALRGILSELPLNTHLLLSLLRGASSVAKRSRSDH